MKKSLLPFFVFGISFLAQAQMIKTPKTYVAHKATSTITIDGNDTEDDWQRSTWSDKFIDIEGVKTPKFQTNVKMLWDDEFLYFFAKLDEPHIWADIEKRDEVIFYNNDFEIFIDPDGDTMHYMEFEMNALNTVWDLMLTKAYREGGRPLDNWDIKGIKTAVSIHGSLNDASDKDEYWTVEIAMPWEALNEAQASKGGTAGEFWRINFSRVNWDYDLIDGNYQRKKDKEGKHLPEYNWVWSPQYVINMHEPEHWGYVYFSDNAPGEKDTFTIPQDEKIRWAMYEVFGQTKQALNKTAKFPKAEELGPALITVDGKKLDIHFEKTASGWNIYTTSPFTNKSHKITNEGRYLIH